MSSSNNNNNLIFFSDEQLKILDELLHEEVKKVPDKELIDTYDIRDVNDKGRNEVAIYKQKSKMWVKVVNALYHVGDK